MKLWPITTENKCFVKMLWHLLGKCVKATVFLVYSSDTVAIIAIEFFFFFTTTENKCFVKMLWHLLDEYVKATVLLVCSICTVMVLKTEPDIELFFF